LRIVRQIVLDTETTGLELSEGHRVIEIGCVELLHRRPSGRTWHRYVRPEREVEAGALAVHGITNEFLASQPRFAEIAGEFLEFIAGAELVIHNAPFDVGFLDAELARAEAGTIAGRCTVFDTLTLARSMHPGQRNSLDALCKRYGVDNSRRDLHGALLDARILADVYLAMSGGQAALSLHSEPAAGPAREASRRMARGDLRIPVIVASAEELADHEKLLESIEATTGEQALFRAACRH
jgi:DNA polymerase-3 subunit epsilon